MGLRKKWWFHDRFETGISQSCCFFTPGPPSPLKYTETYTYTSASFPDLHSFYGQISSIWIHQTLIWVIIMGNMTQNCNFDIFLAKLPQKKWKLKNLPPTSFRDYSSAYLVQFSYFKLNFWRARSILSDFDNDFDAFC